MKQLLETPTEELTAWDNGVAAVRSAAPQLIEIANRTPEYQARFWEAVINGIAGTAAGRIEFAQLRRILVDAQLVLGALETALREKNEITH